MKRTVDGRTCTKCPEYKHAARRCGLGRILPPTIKGGAEAVRVMGLSYMCPYIDPDFHAKIVNKVKGVGGYSDR